MLSTARLSLPLLGLFLLVFTAHPSAAQERANDLPRLSPNAAVSQTIGVSEVSISYSRPSVRDREIFGGLVPYDEVWRTGANEATAFTLSADATIEGEPLEAGTYALFTIPGRDTWTIIINENTGQWGAFNHDESQDVLRIEVTPEEAPTHFEMMTFVFEEVTDSTGAAVLYWDDTRVPFTLSFDTQELVREKAEEAVSAAEEWQMPAQYAAYALQNDVYLEDALGWIDRSIELERTFQNTALQARLYAALDRYEEAVAVGEEALSMAEEMDETPQGLDEFEEEMGTWENQR